MKTKFLTIRRRLGLGACLALLAAPVGAAAQALVADTSATAAGLAVARQRYTRALGTESVLFDGPEYVDNTSVGTVGHPFFESPEPQLGSVQYRGGSFRGVLLRYDIATDQLVLSYPNQVGNVALLPDKVSAFTIGSHRFVRVVPDSATRATLPAGYYEVLLAGPVSLLARHAKHTEKRVKLQTLTLNYEQTDQLFARTATGATEVSSLGRLLALLPPAHQADLKRYARQYSLRFNATERVASSLQLLRYEATLPH